MLKRKQNIIMDNVSKTLVRKKKLFTYISKILKI